MATFTIKINNRQLNIPPITYSNLYDIHINPENWVWNFGFNAIYDQSTHLIHLLFSGGNVSGTYMAKLVFDKNNCVGKYILPYETLSDFGCFSPTFTGF